MYIATTLLGHASISSHKHKEKMTVDGYGSGPPNSANCCWLLRVKIGAKSDMIWDANPLQKCNNPGVDYSWGKQPIVWLQYCISLQGFVDSTALNSSNFIQTKTLKWKKHMSLHACPLFCIHKNQNSICSSRTDKSINLLCKLSNYPFLLVRTLSFWDALHHKWPPHSAESQTVFLRSSWSDLGMNSCDSDTFLAFKLLKMGWSCWNWIWIKLNMDHSPISDWWNKTYTWL